MKYNIKHYTIILFAVCALFLIFIPAGTTDAKTGKFVSKDTDANRKKKPSLYGVWKLEDGGGNSVRYYRFTEKSFLSYIKTADGKITKNKITSKDFQEHRHKAVKQDGKDNVFAAGTLYLYEYDKKGKVKNRFDISGNKVIDFCVRDNEIFAVCEQTEYKTKKSKLNIITLDRNKAVCSAAAILYDDCFGAGIETESLNKIKYLDDGLYILKNDLIEHYSFDGKNKMHTYKLPKGLAKLVSKGIAGYEMKKYNKQEFGKCGKYVYYTNADGVYRCRADGKSEFKLFFDAKKDKYFNGKFDFIDMVNTSADTFYVMMRESGEDELDFATHIIAYSCK